MRINKSTESSSFDEYLKIISSFNKKRKIGFEKIALFKKVAFIQGIDEAIDLAKNIGARGSTAKIVDVEQAFYSVQKAQADDVFFRNLTDMFKDLPDAAKEVASQIDASDDAITAFFGNKESFEAVVEIKMIQKYFDEVRVGKALTDRAYTADFMREADERLRFLESIYNDTPVAKDHTLKELLKNKSDLPNGLRSSSEEIEKAIKAVEGEEVALREAEVAPEPEVTRPGDAPEPEVTRPGDAPEPEVTRPGDAPEPEVTRPGDAPEPEVPPASTDEIVREGEEVVRSLDEIGDGVEVTDDALKAIREEIANYTNKTEAKIAELTSKLDDALENGDAKTIEELKGLVESQGDVLGSLDKKLKALENSKGSLSPAAKAEIEELIKNTVKAAEKTEDTAGGIIAALAKGGSRASKVSGALMTAVKYSLAIAGGVLAAPYIMGMFGGGDYGSSGDIPPEQGGQGGISDRRRPLSWRERQRQNEGPVFKAIREASKNNNMAELNTLIESAATNERYKQYITEEIFGRKTMIILPREFLGMRYAFVNPTGGDVGKNPELLGDMVLRSLRRMDLGGKQYNAAKRTDGPEAQRILNKAATVILQADLVPGGLFPGAKGRADKALFGDPVETTRRSQRRSEKRSRKSLRDRFEQESLSEPLRMAAKENRSRSIDQIRKESYLKIKEFYELSTNNKHKSDISLDKRADEISKSYHKDAVKDLREQDKTLRDYFAGLGRLYEEESEKRKPDQKELYELHDETGSDLTLSAHPNAIRLSDAMGDGGLVENGLEQKNKMEGVALRTPTGNFESRYANLKYLLQKASK
jgi:hypothetical protein